MNFVQIGEYWINLATITHVHVTQPQGGDLIARVFFTSGYQATTVAVAMYEGSPVPYSLELTGPDAELLIRTLQTK